MAGMTTDGGVVRRRVTGVDGPDEVIVPLPPNFGSVHYVDEATDDDQLLCLKSGRAVTLEGMVTIHDTSPLTPDERREIAAEMIRRWFAWSEGS